MPEKSDVWSYGILTWEIFSLGEEPYRACNDIHQLKNLLSHGVRLPDPQFCTLEMSNLIQRCFYEDPGCRPSFRDIMSSIDMAYAGLQIVSNAKSTKNENESLVTYATMAPLSRQKDDTMKHKYNTIKKGNQTPSKTKKRALDSEVSVNINESSCSASFRNEAASYISVENIFSRKSLCVPRLAVLQEKSSSSCIDR